MKKLALALALCLMACLWGCALPPNAGRPLGGGEASGKPQASPSPSAQPSAAGSAAPSPSPVATADPKSGLVAAKVDGVIITRGEIDGAISATEIMYASLEEVLPPEEIARQLLAARQGALNTLIAQQVLDAKIQAMGLVLSAEQEAQAQGAYALRLDSMYEYVLQSYPDISDSELKETAESLLASQGVTPQSVYQSARRALLNQLLEEQVAAELPSAVDESQLVAKYDTLLEEQKAAFDSDVTKYESALLSGSVVIYRPVRCKVVSQAYLKYDDDVIGLIQQLNQYESPELAQEMLQDQQKRMAGTLASAQALLNSGTAFERVIPALGCNGGYTVNYVCPGTTRFSEPYLAAAGTLDKLGQVSAPIDVEYGVYLLSLTDILEPGTVPLAQVREELTKLLADQLHAEELIKLKTQWLKEADIEIYEENLK